MPPKTVSLSKKCILDTDHVSLILQKSPQVIANAAKHEISVTIVTVQELFNGWVGRINDPSLVHNLPGLYSKLSTTVQYLKTIEVLDFTAEADTCLKKLLKDHPPLRKNRLQKDMRIAAIALSVGATVITRNQRDFCQVPGLSIEDWTL
ncbi:MAG: type II toxin-antitoxin system VapC family toxin [Tychonema bourrellyi B0820]|uniref:Nuclease n=1 Tax=Tychonema bourrellyi FEM_GT703 TaxID=2040638 RepID=A0A2G4EXH9_9CYAN|nr:type II toxin-antitoxin system VapC family toxin [Tychonema bourrellyi]MDQ2099450.1 type II toxin-antitoxin system VapC family toxin [Tychonema bourrellyi B0820]PHX54150.1 nuclease [Tychonema bourrellyi FEM_GT703]